MAKLLFEIWQAVDNGGISTTLCLAGPDGDQARSLLEPSACLIQTFEVESDYEAMSKRNEIMGWGEYIPDPSWGSEPFEPFTIEQRRRQESGES